MRQENEVISGTGGAKTASRAENEVISGTRGGKTVSRAENGVNFGMGGREVPKGPHANRPLG